MQNSIMVRWELKKGIGDKCHMYFGLGRGPKENFSNHSRARVGIDPILHASLIDHCV